MNFDVQFFLSEFPILIPYIKVTVLIAVSSMALGFVLALIIALITHYKVPVLLPIAKLYVSFFRSTPFICQLFFFYFGVAQMSTFIRDIPPVPAIIIVLAMNEAAFMSESIRGALSSIDRGQFEACLSIGMTSGQSMRRVIIPQAIRVAVPTLSNSFISLVKMSSFGFTIGVLEIMAMAKLEAAKTYRVMEAYMAVLFVYWAIVLVLSFLQKKLEAHLNRAY